MSLSAHPKRFSWFRAERNWKGEHALVPVETCYRILNQVSWGLAAINVYTLVITLHAVFGSLKGVPVYWLYCSTHLATVAAAAFVGWPFRLRFWIIVVDLYVAMGLVSIVVGIPPSWAFVVILQVALVSLFYGSRKGLLVVATIIAIHLAIAWGWTTGRLPAFLSREQGADLVNLSRPLIWARVLVVAAGYLAIVVALMRNVLGDLNVALKAANSTLCQLAIEQEHRARAEEARIVAERSAREAQKFEALGRLASGVAHDFNNALCVTKCWSTYLMEVSEDEEVRNAMLEIKSSTENAEHLTQHLLAFSRSETGKRVACELTAVVEQECKTLRRLLPKNIEVSSEISGPANVPLGRGQLQEIMLNLAINARDAMPAGGRLVIQAGTEPPGPGGAGPRPATYARLTVTDSGIGMDEATMARVYEPFFTTKPEGKGTGLGLSMVYGVVSGAGGTISVTSSVGKGTSFTIRLPVTEAEPQKRDERAGQTGSAPRCQVLIVDGKPEIGSLVEKLLKREGFPSQWVRTSEAAVLALEESPGAYGLLVIQGVTPGMSTGAIIERAREKNPGCRVLVLSAPSMERDVLDCVNDGHYQLLAKPFESEGLRKAVAAALAAPPGELSRSAGS